RLDRLPQRLLHLLRLRRKEFEAHVDVARHVREQRRRQRVYDSHAAFTPCFSSPVLRPSHNFTVSSPPSSVSTFTGASPCASNQPSTCSSEKPRRVCASLCRSSSRSCGAKSAMSSRPPGASTRAASP